MATSTKKYEFTGETKVVGNSTVKQIRRLSDGQIGGWIEDERNLSHADAAWVYGNAWVYDNAQVSGDAQVCGDARVYGNAQVCGDAQVYGNAWVYGNAQVCGDAQVYDNARVYGNARIVGVSFVSSNLDFVYVMCHPYSVTLLLSSRLVCTSVETRAFDEWKNATIDPYIGATPAQFEQLRSIVSTLVSHTDKTAGINRQPVRCIGQAYGQRRRLT